MIELIVYREFDDGDFEHGVLEIRHGMACVDVGDFTYFFELARDIAEYPFMILGTL